MSKKIYVVFNNWITDSQILLFTSRIDAVEAFEKIVREQLDPDLKEDAIIRRIATATNNQYFEYSGNGTETIQPFVQFDHCEVK